MRGLAQGHGGPGGSVVVPVTSAAYGLRSHVELEPGPTGLDHVSYARCDQLRAVPTERCVRRRGAVGLAAMRAVDQALRVILDL